MTPFHGFSLRLLALALLLLLQCASQAELPQFRTGPASPAETTSRLLAECSEEDLAQIGPLLRTHHLQRDSITDPGSNRDAVAALLTQLAPGVRLLPATAAQTEDATPFHMDAVDGKIGYLRLGSLTADHVADLDTALQGMTEKGISAIVLDLRATAPSSQWELAADICRRFIPKGKLLFRVQTSDPKDDRLFSAREEPRFRGPLTVLVHALDAGAPEIIAGVLRIQAKAIVIGDTTSGLAVQFSDMPLPSGKLLRIPTARVELSDKSTLFPNGLKPDLTARMSPETTASALQAATEKGILQVLAEPERPRLNEAALVAGSDPERDWAQSRSLREKNAPSTQDTALQRAIDLCISLGVYTPSPKPPKNSAAKSAENRAR